MQKKIVVIKNGVQENPAFMEQALAGNGWQVETIELSKGEPLPSTFEDIAGVFIMGGPLDVLEPSTAPCLKVYLNT